MAQSLVTLKWDLADLIQAGIAATLVITPTAQLTDTTDHLVVAVFSRPVTFSHGTGQLAGIVANDSPDVLPQGTGYVITVTAETGQVIYSETVQILEANGAAQWLDELTPVESVVAMAAYVLLTGGTMLGPLIPAAVALTDAATIAVSAAAGTDFSVTLGGNRTLGTPSSPSDKQQIRLWVTQDATGSRVLSYSAAYNFGAAGTPVLSTAAGKTDLLGFIYDAAKSQWLGVPPALGY